METMQQSVISRPRYVHDCTSCIFLGEHGGYDLYYCPGEPTIVCRYGSDGPEYTSGLVFAVTSDKECYREALKRALRTRYQGDIINYFRKYERTEFPARWTRFLGIVDEALTITL